MGLYYVTSDLDAFVGRKGTRVLFLFIFSCIAAHLGAQVFLTDLWDRLKLLKKNVEANVEESQTSGSARVVELEWGVDPDDELIQPLPDLSKPYSSSFSAHTCHVFSFSTLVD